MAPQLRQLARLEFILRCSMDPSKGEYQRPSTDAQPIDHPYSPDIAFVIFVVFLSPWLSLPFPTASAPARDGDALWGAAVHGCCIMVIVEGLQALGSRALADVVTPVAAMSGEACCLGDVASYVAECEDSDFMCQVLFAYYAGRYEPWWDIAATCENGGKRGH